jgi:hypothetical protein
MFNVKYLLDPMLITQSFCDLDCLLQGIVFPGHLSFQL